MNRKETATVAKLVKQARKITAELARKRDELRSIHSDLEDILESTTEGVNEMEGALDRLSEYV